TPFDAHNLACIDPLHVAGPATAAAEVFAEKARRPDLAVARDEVACRLRCRADELNRLEDSENGLTVLDEDLHVLAACRRGQQRFRDLAMSCFELVDPRLQRV